LIAQIDGTRAEPNTSQQQSCNCSKVRPAFSLSMNAQSSGSRPRVENGGLGGCPLFFASQYRAIAEREGTRSSPNRSTHALWVASYVILPMIIPMYSRNSGSFCIFPRTTISPPTHRYFLRVMFFKAMIAFPAIALSAKRRDETPKLWCSHLSRLRSSALVA